MLFFYRVYRVLSHELNIGRKNVYSPPPVRNEVTTEEISKSGFDEIDKRRSQIQQLRSRTRGWRDD